MCFGTTWHDKHDNLVVSLSLSLSLHLTLRGGTGGGPCPTDDTWYFNDDSNKWEDLNRCITPRTWGGMAPLSNNSGKALLYGGNDRFSKQLLYVSCPVVPVATPIQPIQLVAFLWYSSYILF